MGPVETAQETSETRRARRGRGLWVLVAVVIIGLVIYTQITIFVVQPIGAVPEGRTLIIARMNKTEFIDSADGMCLRIQGNVTLFCRMAAMAGVMNNTIIFARLPYSESLYLISTGGQQYEK